jgi:hypothetical protein
VFGLLILRSQPGALTLVCLDGTLHFTH